MLLMVKVITSKMLKFNSLEKNVIYGVLIYAFFPMYFKQKQKQFSLQ